MKRIVPISLAILALIAIGVSFSLKAADQEKPAPAATAANRLVGTWQPIASGGETIPEENRAEIKVIAEKQWFVRYIDPKTKKLEYVHGGTYTLEGDEYIETVEWAAGSTSELVGNKFKFKIKTEGDTFTQTGIGNPYTTTYKRTK